MPTAKAGTHRSGAKARASGAGAVPARRTGGQKQPAGLTAQELDFVTHYLTNGGNATEAAKAAGYAPKSASDRGSKLIGRAEVAQHIGALQAAIAARQVAGSLQTIEGVQRYWVEVMEHQREPGALPSDRIRCSGMLAKSLGAFVERMDATLRVVVEFSDEGEAF